MNTITGTILGGTIIAIVLSYTITILLLGVKAYRGHLASDSKGIKHLRFQEWNHAYNKYVVK